MATTAPLLPPAPAASRAGGRAAGRRGGRCRLAPACASAAPPPHRPEYQSEGLFPQPGQRLKYLYDGGCSVCLSLVAMLKSRRGVEGIYFENIVGDEFSAARNQGITKSEAMATIHVIFPDGSVKKGMEALSELYGQVGLGWIFALAKLPLLGAAAEIVYKLVSKNRLAIGGGMDAVMALGKINMEEKGEGSCAENGECRDGYSKPAEDGSGAAAAAPAAAGAAALPPAVLQGSALDRTNILGVYLGQSGGGAGKLYASVVNVLTGTRQGEGQAVSLADTRLQTVGEALKELLVLSDWRGVVGVGLPGVLRHVVDGSGGALEGDDEEGDSSSAPRRMTAFDRRHARAEMEVYLQESSGRELVVLSGAEANGYGEMAFGAGRGLAAAEKNVVMMLTLGRGIGVALFDHGVLVRNAEFSPLISGWSDAAWADSACPPPSTAAESPAFTRWAKRVSFFLTKVLDAGFKPDVIIVGGSAAASLDNWAPLLTGLNETPIMRAELTNVSGEEAAGFDLGGTAGTVQKLSGLIGSAVGGALQLQLRDDLARVRAALGRQAGKSPQKLTERELREIFRSFGSSDDVLNYGQMTKAVAALGVKLSPDESREMLYALDCESEGVVRFAAFASWWADLVTASPVALIHTEQEYNLWVDEDATSGRLLVLMVGFTFCKPCGRFKPIFRKYASHYTKAKFAYMSGNENAETVKMGRDRLNVTSSPAFVLTKNGVVVSKFTGANEEAFVKALEAHIDVAEPRADAVAA